MGAEKFLHYRILGPLGQGGMGEVFLAEDERLGRRVALKFLPAAAASSPEASERLRREARSLASLSHPNIAAIHALETEGSRSCLVMEYVEGDTLAARIARRPLPVSEVIATATAIADALGHAHARGVVHRDVKPANILVTPQGVAKLTDFGIAHMEGATQLTAEGFTPGTVSYMSPEQARGAPLDGRSDLFSLGAVLYEALTGVRAFAADRPESTLLAIQQREPEPPSALRSGIPLELERIVLKCLKKDPALRYQHAEDLAADVRALRVTETAATGATRAAGEAGTGAATITSRGAAAAHPSAAAPPAAQPARRGLPRLAIPVGIAVIAAAVYVFGPFRTAFRPRVETAEAGQKSIAVLSFQNLDEPGDPHGIAPIATSLLTVGLGESQVMPVLSAQRIHDVLRTMGKGGEAVKGAEALQVAKRAGAAYVVTGFIYATQPDVVLAAEVASTSDGTVLTASKVRSAGGERGLFAAVDSLTASLRDGLARAGFGVRESAVDVASLTTHSPVAYRAYVHGLDELYQSKWAEAEREFRAAIAADSTFALAWYYAAVATWWKADIDGAQREVQTALRLGDRLSRRDREGLTALGAVIKKDYAGAAAQYRVLLQRYPDDKEFLYGLGEAIYHGGSDYDGALAALERAVEIDPSFATAYQHILDIRADRGEYALGLATVERLLRADPNSPVPYAMKGDLLLAMGDTEGGLAALREALARNSRYVPALFTLTGVYGMLGHFDSLQVALDVTRRIPGFEGPFGVAPGEIFLKVAQGRLSEAARFGVAFEKHLGGRYTKPWEVMVTRFHAEALEELGKQDDAVRLLRIVVEKNGEILSVRGAALFRLVEALIRAGKIEAAEVTLADYRRELAAGGTSEERQNERFLAGMLAFARGRAGEAQKAFEENLPLTVPWTRQWYRRWALARARIAAGDTARAMTDLDVVVKTLPACADPIDGFKAMILLARLYEGRGRRDEALALYRRVAWQYRTAGPGVKANEEALEGIQRLSKPA
jgi:tetratricopeptide (TPR) repeat protein